MTLIGHTMMCEQAGPNQLAQKAATMQLLSDGRFVPGLGAGENLNEHIVGRQRPHIGRSGEMRRSKKTSPPGRHSDRSRSMSAIPRSGPITLRSSAGVSVTTASSVGNTSPSKRWPPRVVPSDNPRTTCGCRMGPSWPSATLPISDSTSHRSSTGMRRYC